MFFETVLFEKRAPHKVSVLPLTSLMIIPSTYISIKAKHSAGSFHW